MQFLADNWIYILIIIVILYLLWHFRGKIFQGEFISKSSTLSLFTENLTERAENGELTPIIGRDREIERVIHILSRKIKNNPVLIGDAGVGKTAIVEGLALKIVTGNVPDILKNKKILSLNLADMISGTKYRGEFESRIRSLVNEIINSRDEIILFIDEVHMLVQTKGTEGAVNISDILKPALARGELHAIGATTTKEFKKYIVPDEALERRFQPIEVEEPTAEMTVEILKGLRKSYEQFHKVQISDEAIKAAAVLSDKYIRKRLLPDKAIDLIDEASASKSLKAYAQPHSAISLIGQASESVRKKTDGMPDKIKELLAELEELKLEQKREKDKSKIDRLKKEIVKITSKIEEIEEEKKLEKMHGQQPVVTADDVKQVVSMWANIPIENLK